MSIKSDKWIRRMALEHKMIEPFEPGQVKRNGSGPIVSYGTSSYGYDVRSSNEIKIFTNINSTIVDPKQFDAGSFVDFKGEVCIIPPNSFALARTVEYFRIPLSTLVVCLGKSTYARCGIIVNVTPTARRAGRPAGFSDRVPVLCRLTERSHASRVNATAAAHNGAVGSGHRTRQEATAACPAAPGGSDRQVAEPVAVRDRSAADGPGRL